MKHEFTFRAPQLRWPNMSKLEELTKSQVLADHQALTTYLEVTRNLDRVDFLLDDAAGLTVGNNIWFEFSPEIESVVFELKAHSKSPGAGDLTLRLRVNGTALQNITLTGGSSSVFRVVPSTLLKVAPEDKLSVDVTAVSGTWRWVTFTVILEPRLVWEV